MAIVEDCKTCRRVKWTHTPCRGCELVAMGELMEAEREPTHQAPPTAVVDPAVNPKRKRKGGSDEGCTGVGR